MRYDQRVIAICLLTSTAVGCGKSGSVLDGFKFSGDVDKVIELAVDFNEDLALIEDLPDTLDKRDRDVTLSAQLVCRQELSELPDLLATVEEGAVEDASSHVVSLPAGELVFVNADGTTSPTITASVSGLKIAEDLTVRVSSEYLGEGENCFARIVMMPADSGAGLTAATAHSSATTIALSSLVNGNAMAGLVDRLAFASGISSGRYDAKDYDTEYTNKLGNKVKFRTHAETYIKGVYDSHIDKAKMSDWFELYGTLSALTIPYYYLADASGSIPFNEGSHTMSLPVSSVDMPLFGVVYDRVRDESATSDLWADPSDSMVDEIFSAVEALAAMHPNLAKFNRYKLSSEVVFTDTNNSKKVSGEFSIKDTDWAKLQCWPSGKIKLYLGGKKPSDAKTLLATLAVTNKVTASSSSYAFTLPATSVAAENPRFWLYPECTFFLSQNRTLMLPYYYEINNVKEVGVSASPTALAFGDVLLNASSDLTLTFTNTGDDATLGTISTSSLGLAAPFTVLDSSTCESAAELATDASCTVVVRYAPTTAGAKTATLQLPFKVDAIDKSTSVAVSGKGLAAFLSVSPGPDYDYGDLTSYTHDLKTFTLTNNASGSITLGTMTEAGIGLDSNGSWELQNTGTCTSSMTLAAGATCTFILDLFPIHGTQSETFAIPYTYLSTSRTLSMSVEANGI